MDRVNAVLCIKGEIHSLITSIRLNSRWSMQPARLSRDSSHNDDSNPINAFRRLNEYLEGLYDLEKVECVSYVKPFHDIIISDKANGPLTSAALSSLSKFILYGFFKPTYPGVVEGINLLANSISHCVFEETDWESDELILIKLLELSTLCFQCDASEKLTVSSAWDVYSTCISIHNHYRASKILKSQAENALVHLTLATFNRAASLSDNTVDPTTDTDDMSLVDEAGVMQMLLKVMSVLGGFCDMQKNTPETVKFALRLVNTAVEAGGLSLGMIPPLVEMLRNDLCRSLLRASQSEDLAVLSVSLRVVFHLFLSIKNHMKVQLEVFLTSVHLRLINGGAGSGSAAAREELALESLLDFCREPAVMRDLFTNYDCDVQCSNLFDLVIGALCVRALPRSLLVGTRISTNSQVTVVPTSPVDERSVNLSHSSAVRVSVLNKLALEGLLAVLRSVVGQRVSLDELRQQTPTAQLDIASPDAVQLPDPSHLRSAPAGVSSSQAQTEHVGSTSGGSQASSAVSAGAVPLDDQVDRWCEGSEDVASVLSCGDSWQVLTPSRAGSFTSLPTATNRDGTQGSDSGDHGAVLQTEMRAAEALRERKLMKSKFKRAADKFNSQPLKQEWLRFAIELGIVKPSLSSTNEWPADARSVGEFLRYTPGLGKTQIGEFISKGPADQYPFNTAVLREFVALFDFSGPNSTFDRALRMFLGAFRLPGEAQCIDRIMEAFAGHLFKHLGPGRPFASADTAFILSFSTIMLNTDLHNPNIAVNKKMTKAEFVRNNRGIDDGKDLPLAYIETLYDDIRERQIQVDVGINDATSSTPGGGSAATGFGAVDYADAATWAKLISQSTSDQAPAVFTPTVVARRCAHTTGCPSSSPHDRDMFLLMSRPLLETMLALWSGTADDQVTRRLFRGMWDYASACLNLSLHSLYSSFVQLLAIQTCETLSRSRSTVVDKARGRKNVLACRTDYRRWKADSGRDLHALVGCSFESLLGDDSVDWSEAPLVRGELMLKIVFHAAAARPWVLAQAAWVAIIELLVWCRSRGALPAELAQIDDALLVTGSDGSGASAQPSTYGRAAFLAAYGMSPNSLAATATVGRTQNRVTHSLPDYASGTAKKSNSGGWMASLGGLLFREDSGVWDASGAGVHSNRSDGRESSLLSDPKLYANANASEFFSATGESVRVDDELLRLDLHSCQVSRLLIDQQRDAPSANEPVVVTALMTVLEDMLNAITAAEPKHSSERLISPSGGVIEQGEIPTISAAEDDCFPVHLLQRTASETSSHDMGELDVVVVLEWLAAVASSSNARLLFFWPKIHAFFRVVFEDKIEQLSVAYPYFMERCVVAVLRCAVQLIGTGIPCAAPPPNLAVAASSTPGTGLDSVWLSLRLMRALSGDMICHVSPQLGAGVLELIRTVHHRSIAMSLEQWYMVFSLLSAATSGAQGRAYVWRSLCFLLEHDMVGDLNFTPCRHLVLRFLHGVFPGEGTARENEGRLHSRTPGDAGGTAGSTTAPAQQWLLPSMDFLLSMTQMALAGLVASRSTHGGIHYSTASAPLSSPGGHMKTSGAVLVSFPMPPPYLFSPVKQRTAIAGGPVVQKDCGTAQSVRWVNLGRGDDAEAVWLETCKILAELCNSTASSAAQRAIYCLRAALLAGRFACISDTLWSKCLQEMAARLPLRYIEAVQRVASHAPRQRPDETDYVDVSQRCCAVVFDLLLDTVGRLRLEPEFQAIWIGVADTLATNASATNRHLSPSQIQTLPPAVQARLLGAPPQVHEEMVGMLEALLRLLRLPPYVTSSNQKGAETRGFITPEKPSPSIRVAEVPTALSPVETSPQPLGSYLTLFGWFAPQSTAAHGTNRSSVLASSVVAGSDPPLGSAAPTEALYFDLDGPAADHDGPLLVSTWKRACSVYPALTDILRQRNPKLVASVLLYLECAEQHLKRRSGTGGCQAPFTESVAQHSTPSKPLIQLDLLSPTAQRSGRQTKVQSSPNIQTV